jgi:membrane protease YdiL (CAAX protease family)
MTFWYAFGTLGLTAFLYWAAYQSAKTLKHVEIKGNLLLNPAEFIFKLIIFGLCLGIASTLDTAKPRRYFGWPSTDPTVDVLIGAGVGLVILFVVNLSSNIAIRVFGPEVYDSSVMRGIVPQNARQWILILPPLFLAVVIEEVLFRALLIGGFSIIDSTILPWVMAVASSIIFGLMHAPQGKLGIATTGLVGFVFAIIFIVSDSLTMVICAHYIINYVQIMRAKNDLAWYEKFQRRHAEQQLAALRAAGADIMQISEIKTKTTPPSAEPTPTPEETASPKVGSSVGPNDDPTSTHSQN